MINRKNEKEKEKEKTNDEDKEKKKDVEKELPIHPNQIIDGMEEDEVFHSEVIIDYYRVIVRGGWFHLDA